jgi:hypothetical protein
MRQKLILYLKFKVSNQKATFVPREHEIYHRITRYVYVIVFDVAGDLIMSPGWYDSRKPAGAITQTRWPTKYSKEWWIIKFSNFKESYFYIMKQILKNVIINIPNDTWFEINDKYLKLIK